MSGRVGEVFFLGGVAFASEGYTVTAAGLSALVDGLDRGLLQTTGGDVIGEFDGRRGSGLASLASPKVENVRIVVYRPRREPREKALT